MYLLPVTSGFSFMAGNAIFVNNLGGGQGSTRIPKDGADGILAPVEFWSNVLLFLDGCTQKEQEKAATVAKQCTA